MAIDPDAPRFATHDDGLTVVAIAALAYIVTDVAHEGLGHGIAYLAVGGRSFVLSTTTLVGTFGGRLVSIGGPAGNFACAGILWLLQRRRGLSTAARLFLWLGMAFSLFWGTGYLIYSGITARGDWEELVRGLQPGWLWRVLLIVVGIGLYNASRELVGRELAVVISAEDPGWRLRARELIARAYIAAAAVASAAALLDPRGPSQILYSALPTTLLANLGLWTAPALLARRAPTVSSAHEPITRDAGWLAVATIAAVIFVVLLGRGVHVG